MEKVLSLGGSYCDNNNNNNTTVSSEDSSSVQYGNDTFFDNHLKLKVLAWASNNSVHSASIRYKISRTFVRQWIQNESTIKQQVLASAGN